MAFDYFKGTFTANTSTGNQAVTGVGFQPKLIRFWGVKQTSTGTGVPGNYFEGWAVSSTERYCIAVEADDAAAVSVTGRRELDTKCLVILADGTPSVDAEADFVSWQSGGFTINWTDAPASAWIIHYEVFGGADLTNVSIVSFDFSTSTGEQAITSESFQADFALFLTGNQNAYGQAAGLSIGWGAAVSSTNRWGMALGSEDNVTTTDTAREIDPTNCILGMNINADAIEFLADFTSFEANGFKLDVVTAPGTTRKVTAILFKGGQYDTQSWTKGTSVADEVITDVGFTPVGLSLYSHGGTTTTFEVQLELDIGGMDGTNQGTIWITDRHALGTSDNKTRMATDKCIDDGSQSSGARSWSMVWKSFDADGYTLTQDDANGSETQILGVAYGDAVAAGGLSIPVAMHQYRQQRSWVA